MLKVCVLCDGVVTSLKMLGVIVVLMEAECPVEQLLTMMLTQHLTGSDWNLYKLLRSRRVKLTLIQYIYLKV